MYARITLLFIALLAVYGISCQAADPNPPAPPASATQADTEPNDTMNATGGEDSTGGYDCAEAYGQFECHGFVAGIYSRDDNPTNYQFANLSDGSEYLNAWQCLDDNLITICSTGGMLTDSLMLAEQCRLECENMEWDGFPLSHGMWELRGIHCEFQPGGNNGYVHSEQFGDIGATSPACISADDPIQFPQVGDEESCQGACDEAQCEDWKPSDYASSRLNNTTKVYTSTIDRDFLYALFSEQHEDVYGCDGARYQQFFSTANPPVESWKVINAAAGDLLYVLGFRSNDFDVKIRKGGCSSCAWISLQTGAAMASALELLINEPVVQIQFKRTTGTTATTTYTMNLTIN